MAVCFLIQHKGFNIHWYMYKNKINKLGSGNPSFQNNSDKEKVPTDFLVNTPYIPWGQDGHNMTFKLQSV